MPKLDLDEVSLYFEVAGKGTPVLMIQGVGVCGGAWRPQLEFLSRTHQVAIFDNRGIGDSVHRAGPISIDAMARDALALMDHLGWKDAHVGGHSMGGLIAQQLALSAPARVKSLGLMCTFAHGREAARVTPWVLWMTLRTRIGTAAMRRNAFLEMLFPPEYLETADLNALAARVGRLVGRDLAQSPAILMKQLGAMKSFDVFNQLSALRDIPTLVLSAEKDRIASPKYGRALSEAIPNSRYIEMKGASHGCTIQMADELNTLYGAFLDETDPTSSVTGRG